MKTWILCLFALLSPILQAEILEPELFQLAVKYEEDTKTLQQQKTAAIERSGKRYLTDLDFAEKSATASGDLPLVAAIVKERDSLSRSPGKEFPEGLPRSLKNSRESYLDGVERIETTHLENQERIDADYLRSLGSLQSKAAENPKLATQIAAEKQRLLERVKSKDTTSGNPLSKEELAKELIGHWYWGSEKLWMAITADGKAFLDTKILTWTAEDDGTVTFVDTKETDATAVCRFDIPDKSFTGTNFDGTPVKGTLKEKR